MKIVNRSIHNLVNSLSLAYPATFLVLLFIGIFSESAIAEPWLANRFAENCAACHSPGRVNLPPPERRCTLSCQGCHVNPNGGGLRNEYGKWNQERWLWSWRPNAWKLGKPKPAPLSEQPIDRNKLGEYVKSEADRTKTIKQLLTVGPQMKTGTDQVDERALFNKHNTAYETRIEPEYSKFLMTIPEGDPLRESRANTVIGGGDIRYFNYSKKSVSKQYSVPMNADIGTQVRPIRHLSGVIEARFMNGPTASNDKSQWDDLFTSSPMVKSAYILIDNLPYNTWIQEGIQRPLFGNYNPDHTNLLNSLTYGTNQSMRAVYKTTSFGTAPNVPFLNVHLLSPLSNSSYSQDQGYIINAGGRFVTYGASFMISHWDTTSTSAAESKRKMTSVNIGARFGNAIVVFDLNKIQRDTPSGGFDAGSVYALETKYGFWRENYLVFNFFTANVAANLGHGNSTQIDFGIKSFPIAGLEVEIISSELRNKTTTADINESRLQGQLHFFF